MIKNIYLVRHGETDYNNQGIMQGCGIDSSLNSKGRQQAEVLSKALQEMEFRCDYIFSSPLKRALETANIVTSYLKQEIQTDDLLKEIYCGSIEGKRLADVEPNLLFKLRNDPYTAYPGGESASDVIKRGNLFLKKLNQLDGESAIIFSHGNFTRCMSVNILEAPEEYAMRVFCDNCSLSLFGLYSNRYKMVYWNKTFY